MRKGPQVRLRKYEDYSLTKTDDCYAYTDTMQQFAKSGEMLTIVSIEDCLVLLRCYDGFEWNFHKDDVILNMSFENK